MNLLGSLGKTKTKSSFGQVSPVNIRGSSGSRLNLAGGSGTSRIGFGLGRKRRDIRDALAGIGSEVQNDISQLRNLEQGFVKASIRPIEQQVERGMSDLRLGLGRRGVEGTLANNELLRVGTEGGRQISDARTMATMQAMQQVFQRQEFLRRLQAQLQGLTQDEVNQALGELGLGAQTIANMTQRTGTETRDTGEGLQNLGSIATAVGSMFAMSDRRLKRDIALIGNDGLNVYQFKYLWSDDVHIGYMADEVEAVRPDAVHTIAGYKAVNYGVL